MTCALDGVHRTADEIVMCDGEVHLTVHWTDVNDQAVYTCERCPDWECPDGQLVNRNEALAMFGCLFAGVVVWAFALGMAAMKLLEKVL